MLGQSTLPFLQELGQRITRVTGDRRETDFFLQRISLAVVRGNATSLLTASKDANSPDLYHSAPARDALNISVFSLEEQQVEQVQSTVELVAAQQGCERGVERMQEEGIREEEDRRKTVMHEERRTDQLTPERQPVDLQREQAHTTAQLETSRSSREREEEKMAQEDWKRKEEERRKGVAEEKRKKDERRRTEEESRRRTEEEPRTRMEETRWKRAEEEARRKEVKAAADECNRKEQQKEQRRLEEQEWLRKKQERRQSQVYRDMLKGEGGGSGMKRSHSSPCVAKIDVDRTPAAAIQTPAFSRDTKPLSWTPRRADVQTARACRFAPAYGSVYPGLTGLMNLGNTCYMNAVIQCISNTPCIKHLFVSERYQDVINYDSELSHGEVAQELAAAIKMLWSGHYKYMALCDLKDVMEKYHGMFCGSSQQDAHEFLMYLLEFLHEDLKGAKAKKPLKEQENAGVPDRKAAQAAWDDFKISNHSFIFNLFWGQHKSTLQCSRCGNQSVKFETFSHLSVPMPSRSGQCSLNDCIRLYLAGETVSGWKCPKCKNSIEAMKRLDIWYLPPILIIHIQRFYNAGMWRKKQCNVEFPLDNLNMEPYIINKEARHRNHRYQLYAVVNHFGCMEGGHYTAFCRATAHGRWHRFNDHEVNQINSGAVQSSASYILFYSAMEDGLDFRLDLSDEEAVTHMQTMSDVSATAVMAAPVEQPHKVAQHWRR